MASAIEEHQHKKLAAKDLAVLLQELESMSDEDARRLVSECSQRVSKS
jgi:hypothetical protein